MIYFHKNKREERQQDLEEKLETISIENGKIC